ncbi:uncharacterized protein LOC135692082 isoform X1 [Rhopilema esculentum]|uniref:uncharacterized protein LOC135692082 isoform X1 n=2 Tax=Rhopilema esculentum TaxID=499914 RepID=UPI0031E491EB
MSLNQITVYCGSNPGKDPSFIEAAKDSRASEIQSIIRKNMICSHSTHVMHELGGLFLQRNIALIYGGSSSGLMGCIAQVISNGGGKVTGVIPQFMCDKGLSGKGPGKLLFMESMHQRKQFMCDQADAFIALPGGFGTMEELVEMITWVQLGLHNKPIGVLNTNNYYKGFIEWVAKAEEEGLTYKKAETFFVVADTPEELLNKLDAVKKERSSEVN